MSLLNLVSATNPDAQTELNQLNQELTLFYNKPEISKYFQQAHSLNETWNEGSYHWLVRQQVISGMRVLDLGCGSGHVFANLKDISISYTGVDWSDKQIQKNIETYDSQAEFISTSLYKTGLESNSYDLVLSFYVLEHLVWPHIFLKEMFRLAKPGGKIVILCPNFRPFGRIPSLKYGKKIIPLKEKVQSGHFIDAILHYSLRNFYYPFHIKKYSKSKFPFLINLQPTCLSGQYYIDNDAVYFVDQSEVESELCNLGCTLITSAMFDTKDYRDMKDRGTCFIGAQKK